MIFSEPSKKGTFFAKADGTKDNSYWEFRQSSATQFRNWMQLFLPEKCDGNYCHVQYPQWTNAGYVVGMLFGNNNLIFAGIPMFTTTIYTQYLPSMECYESFSRHWTYERLEIFIPQLLGSSLSSLSSGSSLVSEPLTLGLVLGPSHVVEALKLHVVLVVCGFGDGWNRSTIEQLRNGCPVLEVSRSMVIGLMGYL